MESYIDLARGLQLEHLAQLAGSAGAGTIGKLSLERPDAERGGLVQMPQMETLEQMMQWAVPAAVGTGSLSPTAGIG